MRVAVVGGGIAGLTAVRRLEALLPDAELTLVEGEATLGGKIVTGGVYDKLGARIESTSVGKRAEINSAARPYNADELKKLQEQLLTRTRDVHRGYKADREDLSTAEKMLLQRLSDEQGKLGLLMKKFVEKFDEMKKKAEQR